MGETERRLFTSESVTEGHPDKVCDQVADAVLDAILAQDPQAHVACEVTVTTGLLLVMGEISTSCYADIPTIARETVRSIGYDRAKYGFDAETCAVLNSIHEQSPDIAVGVGRSLEARQSGDGDPLDGIGAGDQGMMFGYACDETAELMPMPIALAHGLARRLAQVRKEELLPYLRPDGKTQVTVEYEGDRPLRVASVLISAQHNPEVSQERLARDLEEHVVRAAVPEGLLDGRTRILVNPTGRFVVGGPQGDTGLTGRKIIVDTYGGAARHGGGAFSGKDPTKVDRSASYAARYVAKNMVAAGLARRLELWVSYAIGVARPLAVGAESFGTGRLLDGELARIAAEVFDFRPAAIIEQLGLRRPIYRQVAAYGHFGRPDLDLPWERLDLVPRILEAARLPQRVPGGGTR
ncbi:methionine adenosyltransferase [Limnochorda pilosa]|uniref:S-adenosylmethionine synthase n=1 Tax=Limnochorda pilosa TaxID=1555112 RepID=A0A0K2SNX2_LIMPI|nr:methionine adenosyltransferase [Limnochorda pilosa]BAS28815.1 S-adenosylmethionine synthetase [Limnochorda pilosa]